MTTPRFQPSKAQAELGLDRAPYRKYLDITLDVAKSLFHDQNVRKWRDLGLPIQEEALDAVVSRLHAEGIMAVPRELIEVRLQNAIKDLKTKAQKSPQTEVGSASTQSDGQGNTRAFDPIRDV
jgi:hypothetical protein